MKIINTKFGQRKHHLVEFFNEYMTCTSKTYKTLTFFYFYYLQNYCSSFQTFKPNNTGCNAKIHISKTFLTLLNFQYCYNLTKRQLHRINKNNLLIPDIYCSAIHISKTPSNTTKFPKFSQSYKTITTQHKNTNNIC